jgi:hypothetical protein
MFVGLLWILAVKRRHGTLSRADATASSRPRPAA